MRRVVIDETTKEITLVDVDEETVEMKEWKAKQRKKIAEKFGLEMED